MYLAELTVNQFRNYRSLQLQFSPQVNIFFGQNAQGKTNLIEAVALLCLGRSFRTKKDSETIQWEQETTFLEGHFETDAGTMVISIGIGGKEKRIKLNGQPIKHHSFFGEVPVVIFAPDDLQIIKGGPQYRRDFTDLYLAQVEPRYRHVYFNFYKVLQQRNRLLKESFGTPAELDVWDEQLIEKGSKVIRYRAAFIDGIQTYIKRAQQKISGARELVTLEYLSFNGQPLAVRDEDQIQSLFRSELEKIRPVEIERRMSLIGPQRDDLRLALGDGIELRNYGSQGQQRTMALALKLGLVEKIRETRGEYPLLILDDVMSEFDDERKQGLLQLLVNSAQTFITATTRREFAVFHRETRFFQIERGEVIPFD